MKQDLLVIDIECTCGPGVTKDLQEIIEIGAVRVDSFTLQPKQGWTDFHCYVKPRLTSVSSFCTSLTGLTQDVLDQQGVSFRAALGLLDDWMEDPLIFCSWGEYDRAQFKEQAAREGLLASLPRFAGFYDLKNTFSFKEKTRKRYGLSRALERKGLIFAGTPHSALADARNTVRLLPYCFQQGEDRSHD